MKQLLMTIIILFSMVYNQSTYALDFKAEVIPLLQMVTQYNELRKNPDSISEMFEDVDQKIFNDLLKKGEVKELPEIVKISEGIYHMIAGNHRIIFNEKNWKNKNIILNDYKISFSKIKDMNQLVKVLNEALNKKHKKTSFIQRMKDLIFPNAFGDQGIQNLESRGYGKPWYTSPYVIGAGLIAALGVGYLFYKNNKDKKDKKSSSSKTSSGDDQGAADVVSGGAFSVTEVGTSGDHGFFAIEEFNGTLYAGSFGYAKRQMIYRVEPFGPVSPGFTVRESVCALRAFKGMLIANTESDGLIYKSNDGNNWQQVHDGGTPVGCALAVHGDYIYAASANANTTNKPSYIYRSQNGVSWEKVYDSGSKVEYIRELASYGNYIYAFYVTDEKNTFMLKSSDGTNWEKFSTPARMFRASVHKGTLYLASAAEYASGTPGVWKYDGSSFTQIHSVPEVSHVSNIIGAGNDLIAITTKKWKGTGGGASLWVSCGGESNWVQKKVFDETESWGLAVKDGAVYVGTKQDGGGGKIYKAQGICDGSSATDTTTSTPEGEGKSCKESVGFVWKLNKDGNTSIMINKKFADCTIRVNGKSPNVAGGIFKSDGRRYFRFSGHPKQFGPTAKVEIVCNNTVEETINIPDTGKRCAYFPGGWGI